MKNRFLAVCLLIILLVGPTISAIDKNPEWEQVLLPINFYGRIVSPFGGIWSVENGARNENDVPVIITDGEPDCSFPFCEPFTPPGDYDSFSHPDFSQALMVHVQASASEQVRFFSRLTDHSAPTSTLELPVVREHDFRQRKFSLLHVPVNEHSRIDLRIYDPRSFLRTHVMVEVYGDDTGSLLTFFPVELWSFEGNVENLFPLTPSYFYLGNLATKYPAVREERSVRITITPLTTGMDCWAMASVTDNDTNRISLFTPQ